MVRRGHTLLFALVGALAICQHAEATNGLKLTAYGARAAGRGGVDYAFADDAIGPANNPAGMAFVYGNRFDNNWAAINPKVKWENIRGSFNDRDNLFFPVPAYSFGVFIDPEKDWDIAPLFDMGSWGLFDDEGNEIEPEAQDLEEEFDTSERAEEYRRLGSRVRIGLGIFPVTGGKIQMKDLVIPLDPNTPGGPDAYSEPLDWETDVLTLAITPSFAFRITEHFSAGLNLQVVYSKFELDGGIAQPLSTLSQPFLLGGLALNPNNQILTAADIDDAFSWGFSWRAGIMFNSKYFSAGLVYQDKQYMADYLGRATVDGTDEINRLTAGLGGPTALTIIDPRVDPSLGFVSEYDLRVQDFEAPRMVGLGVAIRPHRRFSFGIDYTWIGWKEVARRFKTRLSGGDNPNLDIITRPSIPVRIPLDFKNQHVIALGVTVLALEGDDLVEGVPSWALVLRAGYNYGENPTPGATTLPQQPTISEHHVSGGFTLHWGPLVEINFGWEWALPTELDTPSGPSPNLHRADFTLTNSTQTVEIMFFHFGLGFNF